MRGSDPCACQPLLGCQRACGMMQVHPSRCGHRSSSTRHGLGSVSCVPRSHKDTVSLFVCSREMTELRVPRQVDCRIKATVT